jgi:hypothetical protein
MEYLVFVSFVMVPLLMINESFRPVLRSGHYCCNIVIVALVTYLKSNDLVS